MDTTRNIASVSRSVQVFNRYCNRRQHWSRAQAVLLPNVVLQQSTAGWTGIIGIDSTGDHRN